MDTTFHTVAGLPRSGKTTFLAALWHLINAGELSTKLAVDRLIGSTSHLNAISDRWRKCEETIRTSTADETSVTMHVHNPSNGKKYALTFPDLSGETFNQQIRTRKCASSYVDRLNQGGQLALFVTANRSSDGIVIADLPIPKDGDTAQAVTTVEPWKVELMPEQARLVELLQFLQRHPFVRRRRRVALIVSAWDAVLPPKPTPAQWIEREMPLLHQYLTANQPMIDLNVFGVSAQGGDVTSVDERRRLLTLTPSDRIVCLGSGGEAADLTEPIVWLTEE